MLAHVIEYCAPAPAVTHVRLHTDVTAVVEPCNTVLCVHSLHEHSDVVAMIVPRSSVRHSP